MPNSTGVRASGAGAQRLTPNKAADIVEAYAEGRIAASNPALRAAVVLVASESKGKAGNLTPRKHFQNLSVTDPGVSGGSFKSLAQAIKTAQGW